MRSRSTALGYVGLGISLLAGLLFVVSVFTTYVKTTEFQSWLNLWHLQRSAAVAMLILAIAAIALFTTGMFVAREHLVLAGLICNVFNGGVALSTPLVTNLRDWHLFGVAWYLGIVAAALSVIGGVLAYYGEAMDWEAGEERTTSRGASYPATAYPSLPPTGWYPDPSMPGQERLWAGDRWTAETRVTTT